MLYAKIIKSFKLTLINIGLTGYPRTLKASAVIGKSKSWVTRRTQSNHLFEEAIEQRLWHPVWLAQQMGQDLLGKSLLALEDVLDNGTDSAKVSASALILKMNKMMPEQQDYADEDDQDIRIELKGDFWLSKEQLAEQEQA